MTTVYIVENSHEIEGRWWSTDEGRYFRRTFVFMRDALAWAYRVDDKVKIVFHD